MMNYGPISLLITFSNILEIVMFNRLNQYLQANNILVSEQFGFRKDIVVKKVFTLTNNTLTALNHRQQIGGIFCDLSKVFDCVNHKTLSGLPQCIQCAMTEDTSTVVCGGLWLHPHAPLLREPAHRERLRLAV
ncbi:hypothetical protein Cfor_06369 [Coptotermes formosanus]|uniref:Uncharacterized protein n=1 Tax=Coptotermes formosanus TaxID=36987 RepID=A0A6L2PQZ2_COPFO|nr:hypothetical protein Cfor_06369 [Coptotermes formosanus]